MFKAYSILSCPAPRSEHFSKKLWFLLMRIIRRTVGYTTIWTQRILIVTGLTIVFRPVQGTELEKKIDIHTQRYIYIYIYTLYIYYTYTDNSNFIYIDNSNSNSSLCNLFSIISIFLFFCMRILALKNAECREW